MEKFCHLVFILCFASSALGQSLEVQSHYPASAYVIKRLLPFTVAGAENIKILQVIIQNGDSCLSLTDPYYDDIFHIYCREAEVFDLRIRVADDFGGFVELELNNISVAVQRAPADSFDSPKGFGEPGESQ